MDHLYGTHRRARFSITQTVKKHAYVRGCPHATFPSRIPPSSDGPPPPVVNRHCLYSLATTLLHSSTQSTSASSCKQAQSSSSRLHPLAPFRTVRLVLLSAALHCPARVAGTGADLASFPVFDRGATCKPRRLAVFPQSARAHLNLNSRPSWLAAAPVLPRDTKQHSSLLAASTPSTLAKAGLLSPPACASTFAFLLQAADDSCFNRQQLRI